MWLTTLAEMGFSANPHRTSHPTGNLLMATIAEADARGLDAFAAGFLFQWTNMLRVVDVCGNWLACNKMKGAIIRDRKPRPGCLTWACLPLTSHPSPR